jgi:RNA polymerase sigma-70 factor (ECF subfamily)
MDPIVVTEADHRDTVAQLFHELWKPLRRYLLTLGLRPQEADEVAQETFLRLHQHLEKSRGDTTLRGWVFRVAHNLGHNQRIRGKRNEGQPLQEESSDSRHTPEEELLERDRMERMQAALLTLPSDQAQCLHLRAEGLRFREIAEVMEVSVSTVANLVQRGLTRLGKELE